MHRIRAALLLAAALGLSLTATAGPDPDPEPGRALSAVEAEFREAIRAFTPATVSIVPRGVSRPYAGFSSGVIVSPDGLILSDGDAGVRWVSTESPPRKVWHEAVEIRVPRDTAHGGFHTYAGRVVHRDQEVDTSLVQITSEREGNLPFVPIGRSDGVAVGDFAFALGTAFDEAGRAPATLTAGLIASTEPMPSGEPGGRHAYLYASTAVNQGVNGGPVVDLDGRLVGTISSWVEPAPDAPRQLLARVVPIERIRAVYAQVAGARAALAPRRAPTPRETPGRALQTVFRAAGRRAAQGLVSLEIRRARPLSNLAPVELREAQVPRFAGPASGLLVSRDGWIVTSLYNLTNVGTLVEPTWNAPAGAGLAEGLAAVRSVKVHLPDGATVGARLVGHDRRLGIALLKADLSTASGGNGTEALSVLEPAPAEAFQAGRFVVVAGNPFGHAATPDPLLTVGILSREHPDDAAAAWRGQWQTDAAGLDTNSGGAAVDLEGRLLGLFTLWNPAHHGRSSGIAFIVPWAKIEAALPALRRGEGPESGFLGVRFSRGPAPLLAEIISGTAASRAGLRAGDRLLRVDRTDVPTTMDAISVIGYRCAGDRVTLSVERAGTQIRVEVILGTREEPDTPR